jgi:hypothetical protein
VADALLKGGRGTAAVAVRTIQRMPENLERVIWLFDRDADKRLEQGTATVRSRGVETAVAIPVPVCARNLREHQTKVRHAGGTERDHCYRVWAWVGQYSGSKVMTTTSGRPQNSCQIPCISQEHKHLGHCPTSRQAFLPQHISARALRARWGLCIDAWRAASPNVSGR